MKYISQYQIVTQQIYTVVIRVTEDNIYTKQVYAPIWNPQDYDYVKILNFPIQRQCFRQFVIKGVIILVFFFITLQSKIPGKQLLRKY